MVAIDKVLPIFREVFDDPELTISETTVAADVDGWDSFAHINLIMMLEEAFNVSFTTKEVGSMACVGDLLKLLAAKGVA